MGKKNTSANLINKESLQILESIEISKSGSPCTGGNGTGCAVESIRFDNNQKPHSSLNLSKVQMLAALRIMMLARRSDEKHINLVKQGKSFFHIGCSGHEAAQIAIGMSMISRKDWAWPYYRDAGFAYALGLTPKEYFLLAFGKPECPANGGRQMPGHYGHKDLNIPSQSSPTGTQYLNAVGNALAARRAGSDEIVYVSSGEGTTSQGEFYEAVNWASRERLPVIFMIQDNGYAISVPREHQSMGHSVGHSFCCYSSLKMITYDGSDFFESYKAAQSGVKYAREKHGPVLLHALVERLVPHSSSDDQRKYRPADELERARSDKDPITKMSAYLIENNITSKDEIESLYNEVIIELDEASDWAQSRPDAIASDSTLHIFAPIETRNLPYSKNEPTSGNKVVMVDAINHALHEEMKRNDKMLIFGEDIADPKGGVFTTTKGLSTAFGQERVFNSPLAEASIAGVALGLAVRGFKPVVEIQFGDYIWPAFMQIRDEIATLRYRSNGNFSSAVVIRVAVGGYIHGGLYHSQNIEAFFAHIPGLLIAYPSNAADAKGLLKSACRLHDPVLFCEHKGMYRLPFSATPEPDENYLLEFGKGKIVLEGTDATIITYGMSVKDSMSAAKKIEKELGKSVEIIDLRTIIPWDKELALSSVKKTGRLLVVHEDTITCGFGAEIAATISKEAFRWLDSPVMRFGAKDSHIPYATVYENDVLPDENKIFEQIKLLLEF
ncbi:MAG: bkdA [Ignavibacteria bacterium]|nr:bkdA [Ignavibacteria bacterium]